MGIILRGLASLILGPAWVIGTSLVDFISGEKAGKDVILSLGFSAVLDASVEFDSTGYEVCEAPSEAYKTFARAVAAAACDYGVECLTKKYKISRRPSGLYAAHFASLDVSTGSIIFRTAYRNTSLLPHFLYDSLLTGQLLSGRKLEGRSLEGRSLEGRFL